MAEFPRTDCMFKPIPFNFSSVSEEIENSACSMRSDTANGSELMQSPKEKNSGGSCFTTSIANEVAVSEDNIALWKTFWCIGNEMLMTSQGRWAVQYSTTSSALVPESSNSTQCSTCY